ncbi:MAG: hypothetical protein EHM34_06120, partial [Nitrosopumilales archaeon]
ARPSVGKTSFSLSVAFNVAKKGKKVLFLTCEMDDQEIFDRLLSFQTNHPILNITSGKIKKEIVEKGYEEIRKLPLSIMHLSEATSNDVYSIASKFKTINGLDLLVVDYLGYISDDGESEVERLGKISRSFKMTANLLDCVVLSPHQLNRAVERRSKTERELLKLSDLRDSGHLEQDADVVMFLNRDMLGKQSEKSSIQIAKNRVGQTGLVDIRFNILTTKFE